MKKLICFLALWAVAILVKGQTSFDALIRQVKTQVSLIKNSAEIIDGQPVVEELNSNILKILNHPRAVRNNLNNLTGDNTFFRTRDFRFSNQTIRYTSYAYWSGGTFGEVSQNFIQIYEGGILKSTNYIKNDIQIRDIFPVKSSYYLLLFDNQRAGAAELFQWQNKQFKLIQQITKNVSIIPQNAINYTPKTQTLIHKRVNGNYQESKIYQFKTNRFHLIETVGKQIEENY